MDEVSKTEAPGGWPTRARGVTTVLYDFEDRLIDELSTVKLDRFGMI